MSEYRGGADSNLLFDIINECLVWDVVADEGPGAVGLNLVLERNEEHTTQLMD